MTIESTVIVFSGLWVLKIEKWSKCVPILMTMVKRSSNSVQAQLHLDVLRKFRNNDLILKYKESDAKGSMV